MIEFIGQTGSTNVDLAARLSGGEYLPESFWLVADRQIAGKGRLGRIWNDGLGNFMGSTVIHPARSDPPPASLALVVGLAVHEAVRRTIGGAAGAEPMLKWPNDILLDGAKLAGILLEVASGSVVIGVGVNLVHSPAVEGRLTASLADIGVDANRDRFALVLAECLEQEVGRWRMGGLASLVRRWLAAAHPEGTALVVHPPGEQPLPGTFAGLSTDGNLLLRLADGSQRLIHAGDVFLHE